MTEGMCLGCQQREEIFFFSKTSREALGCN